MSEVPLYNTLSRPVLTRDRAPPGPRRGVLTRDRIPSGPRRGGRRDRTHVLWQEHGQGVSYLVPSLSHAGVPRS